MTKLPQIKKKSKGKRYECRGCGEMLYQSSDGEVYSALKKYGGRSTYKEWKRPKRCNYKGLI